MLNKTTLLLGLLLFLFSSQIFAHSHFETNTQPPAQVEPAPKKIEIAATDSETVMKVESKEVNQNINEKPSVLNYVLPVVIGLVIVLGFGSYWFIFRRKYV